MTEENKQYLYCKQCRFYSEDGAVMFYHMCDNHNWNMKLLAVIIFGLPDLLKKNDAGNRKRN